MAGLTATSVETFPDAVCLKYYYDLGDTIIIWVSRILKRKVSHYPYTAALLGRRCKRWKKKIGTRIRDDTPGVSPFSELKSFEHDSSQQDW